MRGRFSSRSSPKRISFSQPYIKQIEEAIASIQTDPPSAQGSGTARKEITRERVDFKPKSVKVVKANEDKRKVWRVTFRGEPISKVHLMGETMIVSVDRFTGEIVSVSKSWISPDANVGGIARFVRLS